VCVCVCASVCVLQNVFSYVHHRICSLTHYMGGAGDVIADGGCASVLKNVFSSVYNRIGSLLCIAECVLLLCVRECVLFCVSQNVFSYSLPGGSGRCDSRRKLREFFPPAIRSAPCP